MSSSADWNSQPEHAHEAPPSTLHAWERDARRRKLRNGLVVAAVYVAAIVACVWAIKTI